MASVRLLGNGNDDNANRGCLNTPPKKAAAACAGFSIAGLAITLAVYFSKHFPGSSHSDPTPAPIDLEFCTVYLPLLNHLGIFNDGSDSVNITSYEFDTKAPIGNRPSGSAFPPGAQLASGRFGSSDYHNVVTLPEARPLTLPAKSFVFLNTHQDLKHHPIFTVSSATANTGNGDHAMERMNKACPLGTNSVHTRLTTKQRIKQMQTQSDSSFFKNPAKWLANTKLGNLVDAALSAVDPKKNKK